MTQDEIHSCMPISSQHEKLLHTVNDMASMLLATNPDNFEGVLWECLGNISHCVEVDRTYIWKNHTMDGVLYCTQVYEWSETAEPQQGQDITVDIAYDDNIPGWEETLSSNKSVNGLVKNLSQAEQDQLSPQNIISILVVPVFLEEHFWGFVGFDDCQKEREFSDAEEAILRSCGLLFANALVRNTMNLNLMKAREEALASAKAKSAFLANMSHEIRTPINAITGMAAIAKTETIEPKVLECLNKIEVASKQLSGIINNILDISKIEAEKFTLSNKRFSLLQFIGNVRSIVAIESDQNNLHIEYMIDDDVPRYLFGDDIRLSQVIINLLNNAIKFTPKGGDIQFTMKKLQSVNGCCEIGVTVQDSGIGMTDEQMGRLFRAFEQADNAISRQFGGTGLGLAISKGIINMMGGDISIESEHKKGSCFTFNIWMEAASESLAEDEDNVDEATEYDFRGYTALLVEDVEVNREIVVALFEDSGLKIECAENGQAALEMFSASPEKYHIIFMDIHMPIMDGFTATERIRSLDCKEAKSVSIVAMTANAFEEDIKHCLMVGMNDHIAKPVDWNTMFKKTAKYLKIK